jgi:hypothetical protein
MKLIRSIVLLLLLAPAAQAHLLRTTFEECVNVLKEPYASRTSPLPPATAEYTFQDRQWRRTIQFWRGRAHCISFSKRDGSALTFDEVQGLLDRFGDRQQWLREGTPRLAWRSDHTMCAITGGAYGFSIVTAEFFHAVRSFP